jgi:SAM-dependent methyltransferase
VADLLFKEKLLVANWSSGYIADIGYTYGYYAELNSLRLRLTFLNAGLVPPASGTACELGFGQGLSTNIHAAASITEWHGTDFNPSQAAFAQELAGVAGAGAKLHDAAFADFATRPDLPDFDYIGLHGIWSWISDDNRAVIVDFIRRKLKVGGVLYISYNTLPGWASFAPVRHLMTEHAAVLGAEGRGIVGRIDEALDFTQRLFAINPAFLRANASVAPRLDKVKEQNRHYLAHEYFNRDWHPMYFATMADWLEPAKLSYACSAHYLDHVDLLNLTPEQSAFLKEIPDPTFRESVRDFMVNQQFRRDYWVRGPRRLSALEQAEQIRGLRVILTTQRSAVSLKVTGSLGEASMSEAVYTPILDALADLKPRTIAQLEQAVAPAISYAQVLQAVMVLAGQGSLATVQDEAVAAKARKACERLNAHILAKARGSEDINYLASPVTGGGVSVNRPAQLFLLAASQGRKQPADWGAFAWQIFAAQGQRLIKNGKTLETAEENLAELIEQAKLFAEKQLPVLKALQAA